MAVDGTTSFVALVCLMVLEDPLGQAAVGAGWSDGGGKSRLGGTTSGGRSV
jgi:hypothetical protein